MQRQELDRQEIHGHPLQVHPVHPSHWQSAYGRDRNQILQVRVIQRVVRRNAAVRILRPVQQMLLEHEESLWCPSQKLQARDQMRQGQGEGQLRVRELGEVDLLI